MGRRWLKTAQIQGKATVLPLLILSTDVAITLVLTTILNGITIPQLEYIQVLGYVVWGHSSIATQTLYHHIRPCHI